MPTQNKISFNLILDEDDNIDLSELREDLRDILHQTSDYWHDNIASYVDGVTGELVVNVYPKCLRNISQSRQFLKDAFGLAVDRTT